MNTRSHQQKPSRAARRQQIQESLALSIEELVRRGDNPADITVEEVATRAGISRASFYVYFEGRADLIRSWFGAVSAEILRSNESWEKIGEAPDRDDVRTVVENMFDSYLPHLTVLRLLHDTAVYDRGSRDQYETFVDGQIMTLRHHIADGQRSGSVDPVLPPLETASWLVLLASRMFRHVIPDTPRDQIDDHIETYADIVWNTLYLANDGTTPHA